MTKSSKHSRERDRIEMRLHEVQRVHHPRRVEFLLALASGIDFDIGAKARAKLVREAKRLAAAGGDVHRAASAAAHGAINVRANVVDVLRRIGGAR